MHIESSAFAHEGTIPTKYTCDGENIAPPLLISGIPENTKSLAIIMEDPDVPTSLRADGLFVHWVVWDIPPDTTDIPENAQSIGTVGLNTREQNAYTWPCPPDREHRYFWYLYALDTMLDLPADSTKSSLEKAMEGHIIDRATLMGRYDRS